MKPNSRLEFLNPLGGLGEILFMNQHRVSQVCLHQHVGNNLLVQAQCVLVSVLTHEVSHSPNGRLMEPMGDGNFRGGVTSLFD